MAPDEKLLLATTDAAVWADEFCSAFSIFTDEGVVEDKCGLMIGWFANAIEVARSAGLASAAAEVEAERNEWRDAAEIAQAVNREWEHAHDAQQATTEKLQLRRAQLVGALREVVATDEDFAAHTQRCSSIPCAVCLDHAEWQSASINRARSLLAALDTEGEK